MILQRRKPENKPLVSVVLCTYNRAHYIRRSIDSVLSQKINFNIEILIGDDASTDDTKEILLDYQKRYPDIFTLLLHEKNNGTGSNWAQLMKLVQGKYVALCDDDDYWHYEEKIQKQVEILEGDISVGLVHTDFRFYYPKKNRFKEVRIKNLESNILFQSLFDGDYIIITSTVVFRSELLDKYVNLDDYIKLSFPIQDWVTWMQIANHTNFYHLDISTSTYCLSEDSVTRSKDFDSLVERYDKEQLMYKYICTKYPQELSYDENRWNRFVNKIFLAFAFNSHDFEKAHYYGRKIDNIDLHRLFSKNIVFFKIYVFLKKIYKDIKYGVILH